MLKILVLGQGKLGKAISTVIRDDGFNYGVELCGVIGKKDFPGLEDFMNQADVVIDATNVASVLDHAEVAEYYKTPMIIAVTGLTQAQKCKLSNHKIPIRLSPNMAIGLNQMVSNVKELAKSLDNSWNIQILEWHHVNKVDSPSGTTLFIAKRKKKVMGVEKEVSFTSIRVDDEIGRHDVIFSKHGEKITMSHTATNRDAFAYGAIRLVNYIPGMPDGLYESMA